MAKLFLTGGDTLQIVTAVTCSVDAIVFYNGGRQIRAITTATTTDLLTTGSEAAVESIMITNKHASNPVTVTPLLKTAEGVTLDLAGPTVLLPGTSLTYTEQSGFVPPTKTLLDMTKYVTANSVHPTAATFAKITGLSFPVIAAHVYTFEASLFHITNATTTGAQFGVGGVAATFVVVGVISTVLNSATAAVFSTGVATAVDTAACVQTTGAAANGPSWFAGCIQPSASGDLEIRATSEVSVAAGLTVLKGSWCRVRETDN